MSGPTPAGPSALSIAQARILQSWIASIQAEDPVRIAPMVPEVLMAAEIAIRSRLRSPSPKPVVVNPDLTEEELA